jgi:sigma-E factor negative regulatory protein RseB
MKSVALALALASCLAAPVRGQAPSQEGPPASPATTAADPAVQALQVQIRPSLEWPAWAARMTKAQQSLNYDATLVIDLGRDWDLVEVTQRIGAQGPEQQIVALNGDRRRYVHTSQGMSLLGPEGDMRLGQAPSAPGGLQAERLAGAYKVTLGGRDRVAGRIAIRLTIEPVSNDRFGLRLWLDADTGLPLRSERVAADGSILERRMVTRINVLGFAGIAQPPAPTRSVQASTWTLPAGFVQVGEAIAVPGIAGARQWILSDGLAWVSVYRLPLQPGHQALANGWRRGAMGQVALHTTDAWIYVLGDLPNPTLEQLGEAVLAGQKQ